MDELLKYVPGRSISSEPYPFYHFSYDVKGNKRAGRYEYTKPVVKTPKDFKCHKCGLRFATLTDLTFHHAQIHDIRDDKGRRPKDFNNDKEYKHPATRGELEQLQLRVLNNKINKPKMLVRKRTAQSKRDRRAEAERRQQLLRIDCYICNHSYTLREDRANWKGTTYTKCQKCGQGYLITKEHGAFIARPTN